MRLNIPYGRFRAVTFGGRPHPGSVLVEVPDPTSLDEKDLTIDTRRLASAPGWMVLLVTYDARYLPVSRWGAAGQRVRSWLGIVSPSRVFLGKAPASGRVRLLAEKLKEWGL